MSCFQLGQSSVAGTVMCSGFSVRITLTTLIFWLSLHHADPKTKTSECLMLCQWEGTQKAERDHSWDRWQRDIPHHRMSWLMGRYPEGAEWCLGSGWALIRGWWAIILCSSCFSGVLILFLLVITVISVTTISTVITVFYFVSIMKLFSQPWILLLSCRSSP